MGIEEDITIDLINQRNDEQSKLNEISISSPEVLENPKLFKPYSPFTALELVLR
jgi:hypothetical protein